MRAAPLLGAIFLLISIRAAAADTAAQGKIRAYVRNAIAEARLTRTGSMQMCSAQLTFGALENEMSTIERLAGIVQGFQETKFEMIDSFRQQLIDRCCTLARRAPDYSKATQAEYSHSGVQNSAPTVGAQPRYQGSQGGATGASSSAGQAISPDMGNYKGANETSAAPGASGSFGQTGTGQGGGGHGNGNGRRRRLMQESQGQGQGQGQRQGKGGGRGGGGAGRSQGQ